MRLLCSMTDSASLKVKEKAEKDLGEKDIKQSKIQVLRSLASFSVCLLLVFSCVGFFLCFRCFGVWLFSCWF